MLLFFWRSRLKIKSSFVLWLSIVCLFGSTASSLWACACGCGVFDVGTSGMIPTSEGGMAYVEYDFLDQDTNRQGTSRAPSETNDDKRIKTNFVTAGAQYMANRRWGGRIEIPYWSRTLTSADGDGPVGKMSHAAWGDIRLKALYAGFSPDMSTGLSFGLKLPTGDHQHFDRDTAIGTGSTDVLLGAFHRGPLANRFGWFLNGEADLPVLITPRYRPGSDINAALGAFFNGWRLGRIRTTPIVQFIASHRWRDTGEDADRSNSGYGRAVVSPGVELVGGRWHAYADVGWPVWQNVYGHQLTAKAFYKVNLARRF